MIFNCAKYLCGESALIFVPVPYGVPLSSAIQRIKSHAKRMRRKALCEAIYACDTKGQGMCLVRVLLDEPIKKKQQGRPMGVKNKPKPLELLEYMEGVIK